MGLLVAARRLGQGQVMVLVLVTGLGVSMMVTSDKCRLSPSSASDGCGGLNGFDAPQSDQGH